MSTTTRLFATGKHQLEFVESTLATPQEREVLIQTLRSGISHGTELAVLSGSIPSMHKKWEKQLRCFTADQPDKTYPVALGYELVGKVTEVGKHVTELKPGDYVWVDAPHQTRVLFDVDKTPYLKLDDEAAAHKAVFLALTRVALAGVHDAHPQVGDVCFVSGLGVIGMITIELLQLAGASKIFASDPLPSRRRRAVSLGAIAIDSHTEDVGLTVKRHIPQGVDLAIECSGASHALHDAVKACGIGGRVVTVASYREGANNFYMGEEWHRNRITLISSMSVNGCPARNYPRWDLHRLNATALTLLQNNRIEVEPLISHEFPFADAKNAYDLIRNSPNDVLKVVFTY